MSSCCSVPVAESHGTGRCPISGTKGRPVELQTVKALLTERALRSLNRIAHRFCPDPDCEVVYFDASGQTYLKGEVRVAVWQKEPFGSRLVCYCFGENEAEIRAELERSGRSEAAARVRAHIEAGRCACEVRNPRGACCLGDVTDAVKRVTSTVGIASEVQQV